MFEHRLGLALGKTIAEIRAMPYAEYRRWQLYAIAEPFGWKESEYRLAAILAMLHNINVGKGKAKKVTAFMRDILGEIEKMDSGTDIDLTQLSKDDLLAAIKKDFGLL